MFRLHRRQVQSQHLKNEGRFDQLVRGKDYLVCTYEEQTAWWVGVNLLVYPINTFFDFNDFMMFLDYLNITNKERIL